MLKVLGRLFIFVLAFALIGSSKTEAASAFTYQVSTIYTLAEDGASIKETWKVTNETSREALETLDIPTPTDDAANIKAYYQDGTAINAVGSNKTTKGDAGLEYTQIKLSFPRQSAGLGRTWQFSLEYDSGKLIHQKGKSRTVFLPQISNLTDQDDYELTMLAPISFGETHYSITPATVVQIGNDLKITYNKGQLKDKAAAVMFGEEVVYQLNLNATLENKTLIPAYYFLTLPPDMAHQEVFINGITPTPKKMEIDEDGNVKAYYFLQPRQKISVQTDVLARVRALTFDTAKSGYQSDIPDNLVRRYSSGYEFWEAADPKIQKQAKALVKKDAKVVENVRAIYDFVTSKLSYNSAKFKASSRQGAIKAMENPKNSLSIDYADLTVSLLRASGIPARVPVGFAYSPGLKKSDGLQDAYHAWVEVFIPEVGWISIDPVWGEKYDNFGSTDFDHFAFLMWGTYSSLPAPIQTGNEAIDFAYETSELKVSSSKPESKFEGKLQTIVIPLPFVNLIQVKATNSSNRAIDGTKIDFGQKQYALGSMAPSQQAKRFLILPFWQLGSGKITMDANLPNDQNQQLVKILAESQVSDFNLISLALGIILIVGIGFLVYHKLSKQNKKAKIHIKAEE